MAAGPRIAVYRDRTYDVLKALLYRLYERRLLNDILRQSLLKHLGLIQDGHRRYARGAGLSNSTGYALGAAKAEEVLTWCAEFRVPMVTLWWLNGKFQPPPR